MLDGVFVFFLLHNDSLAFVYANTNVISGKHENFCEWVLKGDYSPESSLIYCFLLSLNDVVRNKKDCKSVNLQSFGSI